MRRPGHVTLTLASHVALVSAFACSSPEGAPRGNDTIPVFNQPGNGGTGGATGAPPVQNPPTGNAGSEAVPTPGLNPGAGGSAITGGAGATGTAGAPAMPAALGGYFESDLWKGYAWTGTESPSVGTTITPTAFTTLPPGQPFCVSGSVAPDPAYQGIALLGFNINQAAVPAAGEAEPPALTATPTATGVAINFTKSVASTLRIQIQGPNGATDENDRWCYEIPEPGGRAFAPYSAFNTRCWVTTPTPDNPAGQPYARQPLEAVVFTVPGSNLAATPFDFCIAGFADGESAADAPDIGQFGGGPATAVIDTNFGRQKVLGSDNKSYIVQNNAWNAGAVEGAQQLELSGNSFTVTQQNNPSFGNIPISFPSIFIGKNGFQGVNGSLNTDSDDDLPLAINNIASIASTLRHNGGSVAGEYNVTYDIWFANTAPVGEYDDASAAFLMVWLYKPAGKNPIGLNPFVRNITIPGAPGTWDIWVGRRGENGAEDNLNDNAPVISYVPTATIPNFQADLASFINDAVARSSAGGLNGFTFGANLVLTDIFGGMEIWSGGQGLSVQEFTVDVVPR